MNSSLLQTIMNKLQSYDALKMTNETENCYKTGLFTCSQRQIMLWELGSETCILQMWMWGEDLFTKNQQKTTRTVPTRNKATHSPHCSPQSQSQYIFTYLKKEIFQHLNGRTNQFSGFHLFQHANMNPHTQHRCKDKRQWRDGLKRVQHTSRDKFTE